MRGQHSAAAREADVSVVELLAPQDVRAGERRVTAELYFDGRREPAKRPLVVRGQEERGFGEIHLGRDVLHPGVVTLAIEEAYRGRVSFERLRRECVDLKELHSK
jgi:hypothetical protein